MQPATIDPKKISLNDFETVKVLGKGSYAKVTLVRKITDGKVYAMKILKKNYIAKKKQEEHTLAERNILVQCDFPFIIHMQYSFQNEKKLFFVLEFCQGGELFNLLCRRRRFSEQVCKFYASQMVLSMEYLHSKDIIYRDLKPENVLIDNVGYIRITDFGLSKHNVKGNDALSVCGTPEYLAPEVLLKKGHGKAVDWWTLGCIIYEMYVGIPPYYTKDGESRKDLFLNIKEKPVSFPSETPPYLKSLLQGLLTKDPEQRLGGQGAEQVKMHPWFVDMKWQELLEKKIRPPYYPNIQDEIDTSNFDEEFTTCDINSYKEGSMAEQEKVFPDFTYNAHQLSPGHQDIHHDTHDMHEEHHTEQGNGQINYSAQIPQQQQQTSIPQVTQNPDEGVMELE